MKAFLLLVILLTALCVSVSASGATWYVDGSVGESGDGTTWGTALKTIQEGINVASDGDTVIVLSGTYVETVHFDGKNIVLTSTDPLDPTIVAKTIIDGNKAGSVVTFHGTERPSCVLSGFTIQNGNAESGFHGTVWPEYGGGILGGTGGLSSRATIRNNVISGNAADFGGGIALCDGVVQESRIVNNRCGEGGGGLSLCNGVICGNVISNNYAEYNGGGLSDCQGTITGNVIEGNRCTWAGGGLAACNGSVQGNLVMDNDGGYEGGALSWCGAVVRGNHILGNRASFQGGGLSNCTGLVEGNVIVGNWAASDMGSGGGLAECRGRIYGNVIVGNVASVLGGGLASCSGPVLNNTVAKNRAPISGGGFAGCHGVISNCIIWGNEAADGPQLHDSTAPTFSCIEGWEGNESNTPDDPLFLGNPLKTGQWTGEATFEPETYRSSMRDDSASWDADSLRGRLLSLYYAHWDLSLFFLIETNTASTITVLGDTSFVAHSGSSYEVYDYRLDPASPCVDAGDNLVDVGRFDPDGNYRRINTTGKPGWSGKVDYIVKDEGGAVTLLWKGFIDMGAYECQVFGEVPETFSIYSRESMEWGDWIEVFSGNVCTWTDLQAAGRQKFYRVEMK